MIRSALLRTKRPSLTGFNFISSCEGQPDLTVLFMAFRGFTEEDLSQIKGVQPENVKDSESDYDDEEETEEHVNSSACKGPPAFYSSRGNTKVASSVRIKPMPFNQGIEIPKEAMLSTPSSTVENKSLVQPATENLDSTNHSSTGGSLSSPDKQPSEPPSLTSLDDSSSNDADFKPVKLVLNSHLTSAPPSAIGVKLDLATVKSLPLEWDNTASLNALIEFEQNRKKLEDLNDKKKRELKKALEEKAKKTEEDMKKISEISQELKKLDSTLSNDVSILRKQIEIASWDFNDAQKRFDKAEKEYLEAKLELFTKREKKELLTGHLCSIIEQNEFRKAKKLSDLMGQLEIGSKDLVQQTANPSSELGTIESSSSNHSDAPLPT